MRILLLTLFLAACSAARPLAAQRTGTEAVLDTVIRLERQTWADWQSHDLRAIQGWSAPDYWSVNEEGPGQGTGLADIERDFDRSRLDAYVLDSMVARQLTPDVVVVTYNARFKGSANGKDTSRAVAEASVWVRRDGRWINVFLHEVTRTPR